LPVKPVEPANNEIPPIFAGKRANGFNGLTYFLPEYFEEACDKHPSV
jgi:hypothetical protein